MPPFVLFLVVTAAGWDGWYWLALRLAASPEEGIALMLALTFIVVMHLRPVPWQWPSHERPMLVPALLLVCYAASHFFAPPIIRSALAVMASLACLALVAAPARLPVAFFGLVALAMPVLPSLQFLLGYPMRVASAVLTVVILQMQGHAVAREAANLVWRGETIQFDAPCSGVSMLRAAVLLTLMGCIALRSSTMTTLAAVAFCAGLTIICNALRAASLFYLEAGIIAQAAPWWHDGVGVAAFGLLASTILWMLVKLNAHRALP